MTNSKQPSVFKSIWAVVAGMLTVIILSILTDALLEATGIFPPQAQAGLYVPWMLGLALSYRTIYAVVGGYITATLAPTNIMNHVIVLLTIGTIMGILGAVSGWNLSQHWYPISLVITSAIGVWFGGRWKVKQLS